MLIPNNPQALTDALGPDNLFALLIELEHSGFDPYDGCSAIAKAVCELSGVPEQAAAATKILQSDWFWNNSRFAVARLTGMVRVDTKASARGYLELDPERAEAIQKQLGEGVWEKLQTHLTS